MIGGAEVRRPVLGLDIVARLEDQATAALRIRNGVTKLSFLAHVIPRIFCNGCGAQKLVMQQRGKCGVTLQAQVRRRSLGMLADGGALLRRMERLGPTSGAVASDCNR
jgi:hypothetical protein